MRSVTSWSNALRKNLRKSSELIDYVNRTRLTITTTAKQREIARLARLISEIELGLTLLQTIAPSDPSLAVSTLLTGYRYPAQSLNRSGNWRLVQNARFYLVRRKGRLWEKSLVEYMELPESLRGFSLNSKYESAQQILTSLYPQRHQLYRDTLLITPEHRQYSFKAATEGVWYAKVRNKGRAPVEVPIAIPQAVAELASQDPSVFARTRNASNPPLTVSIEQLHEAACEMDLQLASKGHRSENYSDRLSAINFQFYCEEANDFREGETLTLSGLSHVVGLLNVGKTTVIEILLYHLAKQGRRCALIVNDTANAVQIASKFAHQLDISAAPILGRDRSGQLKKVYEPILSEGGEGIVKGGNHPAWRWFSPICPLLALVRSDEKWSFGEEPCHSLYQKEEHNNDQAEKEDEMWEEEGSIPKCSCPLYFKCPRHQLEKDIAQAKIWILTPGSWIHTRTPWQVLPEKMTFAEAVYRECDVLFVDEADRVQVQLDEAFAPSEVLLDNSGNSFLNRLAINVSTLYTSNRSRLTGNVLSTWKRANDNAQISIDRICHQLYNNEELVDWLGSSPFTGRSLFARLIREVTQAAESIPPAVEPAKSPKPNTNRKKRTQQRNKDILAGLPALEVRERQQNFVKALERFLENPLQPGQGGKLSEVGLLLLTAEDLEAALPEISEWWRQWSKEHSVVLPKRDELEALNRRTVLAILVTILDNRLSFLLESLYAVSRLLDLHKLSQALVHRPPRDYLSVIPSAPVGNILGFRYTQERDKTGGKLDYFRYVGVGRFLLLNFPTLFEMDDIAGAHTLLISGTSYAPGTPIYHIPVRPSILLKPAQESGSIGASQFAFTPQSNGHRYISISGHSLTSHRQKAGHEMVEALCRTTGGVDSYLNETLKELEALGKPDKETSNLWADRKRILILTNSYDEAEWVTTLFQRYHYGKQGRDQVAALKRDQSPKSLSGIRRSQIRILKDLPTNIVVAPLMALERGHNILNNERIAAFGAALFFCRPMPVPDDWQSTVRQLNAWALKNFDNLSLYKNLEASTLFAFEDRFYRLSIAEIRRLNCRAHRFDQLSEDERKVLCWTQLVSIWQVIGRLVRGHVPCMVDFLDAKFAPTTAYSNWAEQDTAATSLLIGIRNSLKAEMEASQSSAWRTTLTQSLYNDFYTALMNTKGLNNDC
ncbi:MAG: hypothetical protein AAFN38_24325 [Cyanobacteria bacterium J06560_5]